MIRSQVRRSMRLRRCEPCGARIAPYEMYREVVASPGHGDLGNDHWWRLAECRTCSERYGRWPTTSDAEAPS